MKKLKSHVDHKQYRRGAVYAETLLKRRVGDLSYVYYLQSLCYVNLGNVASAVAAVSQAMELNPSNRHVQLLQIRILNQAGQHTLAHQCAVKALALARDDVRAPSKHSQALKRWVQLLEAKGVRKDLLSDMPSEIIYMVLDIVSLHDVLSLRVVSSHWRSIVDDAAQFWCKTDLFKHLHRKSANTSVVRRLMAVNSVGPVRMATLFGLPASVLTCLSNDMVYTDRLRGLRVSLSSVGQMPRVLRFQHLERLECCAASEFAGFLLILRLASLREVSLYGPLANNTRELLQWSEKRSTLALTSLSVSQVGHCAVDGQTALVVSMSPRLAHLHLRSTHAQRTSHALATFAPELTSVALSAPEGHSCMLETWPCYKSTLLESVSFDGVTLVDKVAMPRTSSLSRLKHFSCKMSSFARVQDSLLPRAQDIAQFLHHYGAGQCQLESLEMHVENRFAELVPDLIFAQVPCARLQRLLVHTSYTDYTLNKSRLPECQKLQYLGLPEIAITVEHVKEILDGCPLSALEMPITNLSLRVLETLEARKVELARPTI